MKYCALFFCLMFVVNSNAQLVSKKDFRLKDSDKSFLLNTDTKNNSKIVIGKTNQKDFTLAALLSFIVPGAALGQFYKEESVNGAIRAGISVLCAVWFLVSPSWSFHGASSSQKLFAIGAYAINWIASIIDASYGGKKQQSKKPPRGIYKFGF